MLFPQERNILRCGVCRKKLLHMITRVTKQHIVNKSDRRCSALDIQQYSAKLDSCRGGEVGGAETDRQEIFVNAAFGVIRRPTRRVLKQTDRPDATIGAEIEPV